MRSACRSSYVEFGEIPRSAAYWRPAAYPPWMTVPYCPASVLRASDRGLGVTECERRLERVDWAWFSRLASVRHRSNTTCGFAGSGLRKELIRLPVAWWCLVVLVGWMILANPASASAGPIVASCPAPMVPRRALPDDGVCVSPESRSRVAAENAQAPLLWVPGPYGPKTCAGGYVWREATPVDFTCVTPEIRALVRSERANPQLPAGQ